MWSFFVSYPRSSQPGCVIDFCRVCTGKNALQRHPNSEDLRPCRKIQDTQVPLNSLLFSTSSCAPYLLSQLHVFAIVHVLKATVTRSHGRTWRSSRRCMPFILFGHPSDKVFLMGPLLSPKRSSRACCGMRPIPWVSFSWIKLHKP